MRMTKAFMAFGISGKVEESFLQSKGGKTENRSWHFTCHCFGAMDNKDWKDRCCFLQRNQNLDLMEKMTNTVSQADHSL